MLQECGSRSSGPSQWRARRAWAVGIGSSSPRWWWMWAGSPPPDRLAAALYGDDPPPTWRKVVQGSVMRLRRALGEQSIETTADGYRLVVGDDQIDAVRFEHLVERAARLRDAGDPERAAFCLHEALALFAGEPLAALDGWEPGRAQAARFDELRRVAEDRRMLAEQVGLLAGAELVDLERAVLAHDLEPGPAETGAVAAAECPGRVSSPTGSTTATGSSGATKRRRTAWPGWPPPGAWSSWGRRDQASPRSPAQVSPPPSAGMAAQ